MGPTGASALHLTLSSLPLMPILKSLIPRILDTTISKDFTEVTHTMRRWPTATQEQEPLLHQPQLRSQSSSSLKIKRNSGCLDQHWEQPRELTLPVLRKHWQNALEILQLQELGRGSPTFLAGGRRTLH